MTTTRIAVIGTGWWSTYAHIPGVLANPSATLVGVCDRDVDKLAAAAKAYGLEHTYTDYREMIEREHPDGVIIATPHATHYAIARECLERGINVLVEKPMTLYASEARDLVELAQARGLTLSIGYTHNYAPATLRAHDLIASGALGAPQYIHATMVSRVIELYRGGDDPENNARFYPVHGPGAVYSKPELSGGGQGHLQLTHLAGLVFFVTGLRARRVLALMNNYGLPVDLVDAMTIEFEGGALGTFGGSGNAHQGKVELQVHCERGSIVLDILAETLVAYGPDGPLPGNGPMPDLDREEDYLATSGNLVDVIQGRATNGAPGEIGWRAVELLDAAYRSAAQGGAAVSIASLYDEPR